MLLPVHFFHKKMYVFRNLPNGKIQILNLFRRKDWIIRKVIKSAYVFKNTQVFASVALTVQTLSEKFSLIENCYLKITNAD